MIDDRPPQIYSRVDYDSLKQTQRALHDLLPVLDKGDLCGFNCDEFRTAVHQISGRLAAIEQAFMTPPPPM